jgi:hypothetical protein
VSPAGARALRYAPVLVSALALAGVAGWASRQQVPALPEGIGLRLLAAGVALYALATLVRCERWHRLLVLTGVPSARADAYGLVTVGYMANNALVARAGDVLKVLLTAGRTGAGGARVAGLAVGERGLDVLAAAASDCRAPVPCCATARSRRRSRWCSCSRRRPCSRAARGSCRGRGGSSSWRRSRYGRWPVAAASGCLR